MNRQLPLFDTQLPRTQWETALVPGMEFHRDFLSREEQQHLLQQIDLQPWVNDFDRKAQFYHRPFPAFGLELLGKLFARKLISGIPEHMSVLSYEAGVGIGHHVDRGETEQITIISLAHEYEMDLRHGISAQQKSLMLELGSVLILKGEARWEWEHGIRPRLTDHGIPRQRRISITFRNALST